MRESRERGRGIDGYRADSAAIHETNPYSFRDDDRLSSSDRSRPNPKFLDPRPMKGKKKYDVAF